MRDGYSPTRRLTERDVKDPLDFAEYTQQVLGVPFPTIKDTVILRKKIKEFFAAYPQADYTTLCRIVTWARQHRKRPPRTFMVVDLFREAWAGRALPELDQSPADVELARGIHKALEIETDPQWRRRLRRASGSGRREVFEEWRQEKSGSSR